MGRPAPTTALSRSSSPETEATAPIEEIIPETSATRVSAATASQPCPKTRLPTVTPSAPNSCGTAMLKIRIRYASAVSPMTPLSAPMEASAPYALCPVAMPTASGAAIAIAARATAGQGMGAGAGRSPPMSHSGGASRPCRAPSPARF